jgi:hypothetical protein
VLGAGILPDVAGGEREQVDDLAALQVDHPEAPAGRHPHRAGLPRRHQHEVIGHEESEHATG